MHLLVSLALGALAGWIAGKIMKSSHGLLMNIVLGLVGGLIGGWLGGLIGIGGGWVSGLILAVAGACILIWLGRLISGKK